MRSEAQGRMGPQGLEEAGGTLLWGPWREQSQLMP